MPQVSLQQSHELYGWSDTEEEKAAIPPVPRGGRICEWAYRQFLPYVVSGKHRM